MLQCRLADNFHTRAMRQTSVPLREPVFAGERAPELFDARAGSIDTWRCDCAPLTNDEGDWLVNLLSSSSPCCRLRGRADATEDEADPDDGRADNANVVLLAATASIDAVCEDDECVDDAGAEGKCGLECPPIESVVGVALVISTCGGVGFFSLLLNKLCNQRCERSVAEEENSKARNWQWRSMRWWAID